MSITEPTITIRFRAKRDTFSGGEGYKVPRLTSSHMTFSARDMVSDMIRTSPTDDMLEARLAKWAGIKLPGVVWADSTELSEWHRDTSAWTVTPIGKGFMADVSITAVLRRRSEVSA